VKETARDVKFSQHDMGNSNERYFQSFFDHTNTVRSIECDPKENSTFYSLGDDNFLML